MDKRYHFTFPPSLIAQEPARPRDAARLLVYDRSTKKVRYSTFTHLDKFLTLRAVVVFNQTKVIPARLVVRKQTGGKVEILYIKTVRGAAQVLTDRKLAVGSTVFITPRIHFTVLRSDGRFYYLKPSFPIGTFRKVLDMYGNAPLPPYIKHPIGSRSRLLHEYQTIFARRLGSVAAPTASLHFTKQLITRLKKQGFDVHFVTLHVGLGTFAPVTEHNLRTGTLHKEWYEIDAKTAASLNRAKKEGHPIVAVGTTVVRTLESAADAHGRLKRLTGQTDLFIRQGYGFKFINAMVTNFHVPSSSLLMLVSAFAGRSVILKLYQKAIKRRFRLFSFGDGMLIK